ncbi:hypothetical protein DESPIG_02100 [Desulfovibrio piger ATCC 29098]|uniref:Uncharacterized protein n=1 Tax=Desulfovibrio piger ATCC 29098 TaxID=411464 RepID=B6WVI4_9BACT|nr:hypothetical protein DESPIG_02100 [Desulfovibrio piger ATCC 29098]
MRGREKKFVLCPQQLDFKPILAEQVLSAAVRFSPARPWFPREPARSLTASPHRLRPPFSARPAAPYAYQ